MPCATKTWDVAVSSAGSRPTAATTRARSPGSSRPRARLKRLPVRSSVAMPTAGACSAEMKEKGLAPPRGTSNM